MVTTSGSGDDDVPTLMVTTAMQNVTTAIAGKNDTNGREMPTFKTHVFEVNNSIRVHVFVRSLWLQLGSGGLKKSVDS
jgi:hypothetical protein